jgi:IS5 family transposase
MAQLTFGDAELAVKGTTTREVGFPAEFEQVVPWAASQRLIVQAYPRPGNGRRPHPLVVVLRVCLMQNWLSLCDPAIEEVLPKLRARR